MSKSKRQKGFSPVFVVVAIVAVVIAGFIAWRLFSSTPISPNVDDTNQQNPNQNSNEDEFAGYFQIPDLEVEFKPEGIDPLYKVSDKTWNGVAYKSIAFSTEQLVQKGAEVGNNNSCSFTDQSGELGYFLLSVAVYNSREDLIAIESDPMVTPNFSESNVTSENGYLTIGEKIFHIPQANQAGSGLCIEDVEYDSQQRQSLRSSLMTLRKAGDR